MHNVMSSQESVLSVQMSFFYTHLYMHHHNFMRRSHEIMFWSLFSIGMDCILLLLSLYRNSKSISSVVSVLIYEIFHG